MFYFSWKCWIIPLFSVAVMWHLSRGTRPYSWIKPQRNCYCYLWPSTHYTHKTTSPPFIVNTVKTRAGGRGCSPQTCCTQLASSRGTVWLSCLLLFRGEDKALSEGRVPGKQRYPPPPPPPIHTCTHTQPHTHTHTPRGTPPCLARSMLTLAALIAQQSLASPFTVLLSCPCHIYSVVALGWNGLTI